LVLASSKSGYISDLSWVGAPEPGKGRSLWEHPMFHQNQRRSYR
jgi:hypothetical protein